nr:immunoglobulin heavy chain junction region [Macaca mulatta]
CARQRGVIIPYFDSW